MTSQTTILGAAIVGILFALLFTGTDADMATCQQTHSFNQCHSALNP